ncbi:MAG: hypothetical protein JO127_13760 [Caulobacteraceae bacterium]|nr:hypothetical protein [Caulobacteraceae bacterium]
MWKRALAAAAILALTTSAAIAQVGNAAMPIPLKMRRGTDSLTVRGVLRKDVACCSYAFAARGGQKLYWSIHGAAARLTIGYPDGQVDGPGLPNPLPLPASGHYVIAVSPDQMAAGAFGPFVLKLRIPARR